MPIENFYSAIFNPIDECLYIASEKNESGATEHRFKIDINLKKWFPIEALSFKVLSKKENQSLLFHDVYMKSFHHSKFEFHDSKFALQDQKYFSNLNLNKFDWSTPMEINTSDNKF